MRGLLAGATLVLLALPAMGQDRNLLEKIDKTLDRILESSYETTAGLTRAESTRALFGVYTTLSGLATDDEGGTTRVLRQVDGKVWGQVQSEGHMFYGRLRFRYRDFDAGDEFTPNGGGLVAPVGDLYWYRFDWATDRRTEDGTDPSWNWWIQLGRQTVNWAGGLVLNETLYAARPGVDWNTWHFEGLFGYTPRNGTVDFDGSRPEFDTDTFRQFWGVLVEYRGLADHRPFVHFVDQQDQNNTVLPGGGTYGYDSTYVSIGSVGQITGQWLYRVEFVKEFGRSTSDLLGIFPQTLDDIDAWAGHLEIIFLPHELRTTCRLRIEAELLLASGDEDRLHSANTIGGNLSGTKDKGFNSFGYTRTGLALSPDDSNLISLRLGASATPLHGREAFEKLRVFLDAFFLNKMNSDAPMSVTTIPGEGFVGVEVDVGFLWQVYSDFAIDLRYGIFIPGGAITDSDARHFFYLGVSYGF